MWNGRLAMVAVVALLPCAALAETTGFFAGAEAIGGLAHGSMRTTDGGAPGFDGVARDLRLGNVYGAGGEIGYRFDNQFGLAIAYMHTRGSVSWEAAFQLAPITSGYRGTASSDAVMARAYLDVPIDGRTSVGLKGGLGLALNTLSSVVETNVPGGEFLAVLGDRTVVGPAAEVGLSMSHALARNGMLSLGGTFAYVGGYATGETRQGNLGTTAINPYTIDSVWHARINAKLAMRF